MACLRWCIGASFEAGSGLDGYGWNKDERSEHFVEFFLIEKIFFRSRWAVGRPFWFKAVKVLWFDDYRWDLMDKVTRSASRVVFFCGFFKTKVILAPVDLGSLAVIVWRSGLSQEQVGDVFYRKVRRQSSTGSETIPTISPEILRSIAR